MILVVNAGSSSIKFKLFDIKDIKNPLSIVEGLAERIAVDGNLIIEVNGKKHVFEDEMKDHQQAVTAILKRFEELKVIKKPEDIKGIGFRVVHGAEKITESVVINDEVKKIIEDNIKLAPLHNPGGLTSINAFQKALSHATLVGCFDTSFHTTMPEENYIYPVPYSWYKDNKVRKYGFHGISYEYITYKSQDIFKKQKNELNLIVCHLGNGASMASIKNGKGFDTTMGLTPLAGLVMGTRSGDIDPSIIQYISKELKLDIEGVTDKLNKESGLLGLSLVSSDMRDITTASENGNRQAKLALEIYSNRIVEFILKYANQLEGKIDGIIFTAGVGENSAIIRKLICEKLHILGVVIDDLKNEVKYSDFKEISAKKSKTKVYAIRTNEELMICNEVIRLK